jgi:hypothetical protein
MAESDGTTETLNVNVQRLTDDIRGTLTREAGTVAVLALTTSGVKIYATEGTEVSVTDVPLAARERVLCVRTFLSFVDDRGNLQFCVPPYYFDSGPLK